MLQNSRTDQPLPFFDSTYLGRGSAAQQAVFRILKNSGIMEKLWGYTPVLAGTFPLDIQVAGSDLDILCCFASATLFTTVLENAFGAEPGFLIRHVTIRGVESVVCSFETGHAGSDNGDGNNEPGRGHLNPGNSQPIPVEIFGQPLPVTDQMGYRHLLIEAAILEREDRISPGFRKKIVALKKQGIKTEPAFCQLLGLKGDPYLALLEYQP